MYIPTAKYKVMLHCRTSNFSRIYLFMVDYSDDRRKYSCRTWTR